MPEPAQAVEAVLDGWNEEFCDRLARYELSRQAAFYGSTTE
jgi:hypothetical protein